MLLASYDLTATMRARLRFPSEVVETFGNELVLARGFSGSVGVYSAFAWQDLAASLQALDPITAQQRKLARFFFASASETVVAPSRHVEVPPSLGAVLGLVQKQQVPLELCLLCVGKRAHLVQRRWWHQLRAEVRAGEVIRRMTFPAPPAAEYSHLEAVAQAVTEEIGRRGKIKQAPRGRELEKRVAEALGATDIGIVELTRPSQDAGVDVILHLPSEGGNEVIYVQCKSGSRRATVRDVRELLGVVARDGRNAGLLVATSGFTQAAEVEAAVSRLALDLVDAKRLADWIQKRLIPYNKTSGAASTIELAPVIRPTSAAPSAGTSDAIRHRRAARRVPRTGAGRYRLVTFVSGISCTQTLELTPMVSIRPPHDDEFASVSESSLELLWPGLNEERALAVLEGVGLSHSRTRDTCDTTMAEMADAVTALRLSTGGAVAAGPAALRLIENKSVGLRTMMPLATIEPVEGRKKVVSLDAKSTRAIAHNLTLADADAALGEALDRWEFSLFLNEPYRAQTLREGLKILMAGDEIATILRVAALLHGTQERDADWYHALADPTPELVRRVLVRVLERGNRPELLRELEIQRAQTLEQRVEA